MILYCCFSSPSLPLLPIHYSLKHSRFCFLLPAKSTHRTAAPPSTPRVSRNLAASAQNQVSKTTDGGGFRASELLDGELLGQVSTAGDAAEALLLIAEERRGGGVVSVSDCRLIISAALDRGNAELALSVFAAMRASFDSGWVENSTSAEKWKWSRPDAHTYTLLAKGLAASLRVSDALRVIDCVCRVGVSPGEEVPFGKVVRCPSCMIAVAVAQPQQGLISCSKCRYQYELVSGNILNIDSEEISIMYKVLILGYSLVLRISSCRTQHGSPCMETRATVSANNEAKHSSCRALHCGGNPVWLGKNSQEGERVTVAVAAPLSAYREVGPLKFSPRVPSFYPGEPMCLTNHRDGRESRLLRAPAKDVGKSLLSPSILFPIIAVFATGDAASGIVDPSLPQLIAVAVASSVAVAVTFNSFVLPQLNKAGPSELVFAVFIQLPQRSVDITSVRQQLLSQYDVLQTRIKELKKAAENEVWMLARMWQLENKIYAVGEPSYRARRNKVKRVREGLENSLENRIELIESYARISSMIEIEVELDLDVLAAETASSSKWRLQAEANDEAERLLSSLSEQVPER
ncbi:pentatricopeptide repeat (PPR) superfamily protein [Striga asiatica]|uniref:Pentatricopeptide repeat (PPR) superfamily protein n=1 Tax=Striga asiatica TaxID=4170 RepID=A0A5A7Q8D5_STRAF|nr:pentatricopeptide repeat (PPR) superfamily protein [Striga asiatica]